MRFPGPKALEILKDQNHYYATNTATSRIVPHKRRGVFVIDVDKFPFLDLNCGASVATLGQHPKVVQAIVKAAERNLFTEFHQGPNADGVALAKILTEKSPVKKPSKAFFTSSGTEANEAAIKLAEAYRYHRGEKEKRKKTLYFLNGFAGRTHGTLSATTSDPMAQRNPYWKHCDRLDSCYLPYPQKGHNWKELKTCLEEGRDLFGNTFLLEEVDYLLIEFPCQGEGGVIPLDEEGLKYLFQITQQAGIFFIADVIQCGMGRTGSIFGCDSFSWFQPDMLTMAKALAGGMSAGAVIFRADLDWKPKEHSNTFGGNPVAMSAALVAIKETERLIKKGAVKRLARSLETRLEYLAKQFPDLILEVRGWGAMWGIEVRGSLLKTSLITRGEDIVNETGCGLMLLGAGNENNHVIRVMPPLVITEQELDLAFSLLKKTFDSVQKEMETALDQNFIR